MTDAEPSSTPTPTPLPESAPLRSEDLLAGRREVQILHSGEVYRLLVTRNGKLILQK